MVACWTIPEKISLLQIFSTSTIEFYLMLLDYKYYIPENLYL